MFQHSRRSLLRAWAAGGAGLVLGGNSQAQTSDQSEALRPRTVRDAFWIFTCAAGSDNERWGLPGPSRMTPAEGAFYLGVPNLIMSSSATSCAWPSGDRRT